MIQNRKYKKVFSKTRYQANSQHSFDADTKSKSFFVGGRSSLGHKSVFLGKVIESGKAANILDYNVFADISFPHVIGIFGSRGSGKSFDLGVFVEGIFLPNTQKESAVSDAAIVFDIQDQFWTLGFEPSDDVTEDEEHVEELHRWGLVRRLIPNINIWVPKGSDTQIPNAKDFCLSSSQLTDADWLAILELEQFSPMGQALLTLLSDIGSQPPNDLASNCVVGPQLKDYQQGTIEGLRWRLQSLDKAEIISDAGLNVDDLLKPNSLSIVLMRNLQEAIRGLVVGVIARLSADRMGRIQQERKVALRTKTPVTTEIDITNRLWMILDEAHVLVPSDSRTAASSPLIDYVKRGRDAGLSLVFATQQPSAVSSRLMSQVDLTITHKLGFDADLSAAVARMPTRTSVEYSVDSVKAPSLTDVVRSLRPGEAIVADSASSRAFLAKIRPRLTAHGGATPK